MKRCTRCGIEKELSEFGNHGRRPSGERRFKAECKPCRGLRSKEHYARGPGAANIRRYTLKKRYGLTEPAFRALLAAQDGQCAICSRPIQWSSPERLKQAAVDHCHETGRVRGLLCHSCNRALGLLGDSPERLDAAAVYLRCHRPPLGGS